MFTWTNALTVSIVLTILGLLMVGQYRSEQLEEQIHTNCTPTNYKVFVAGRVNKALTIYDCSALGEE